MLNNNVNTIISPIYKVKFPTKKLKNYVGHTQSFVRDYIKTVEEIKEMKVDDDEILLTFDVVSL